MISVHFQGKPINITVIQVCAPTSKAEEPETEQFTCIENQESTRETSTSALVDMPKNL